MSEETEKVKVRVLHNITISSKKDPMKDGLIEEQISKGSEIELDKFEALRLEGLGTVERLDKRIVQEEPKTIFTAQEVQELLNQNKSSLKEEILKELKVVELKPEDPKGKK